MCGPVRFSHSVLLAAIVFAIFLTSASLAQDASAIFQIGSSNTVTADPPVPRPVTTPCVVQLFDHFEFADFNPKPFQFTPPAACPGPWAKVVLEADFSVTEGIQFDRTANIWIAGANIYFGTTAEPSPTLSPHWHVERDLTDYSSLFNTAQGGEIVLGNLVNSTFTGIIFGSARLQFYPIPSGENAPVTADVVLPLSAGPSGGTVILASGTDLLTQTFTLPANIERAFLDVYAQSQFQDEFWYSCVPNNLTSELQSCGGTAFREAEVSIDGQPAGVSPVYPWIFTGGIDPFLWFPIPGVQTLNFVPYRVDLTPFAGALSNGQPHQVAVSVFNADNYFSATASLLLYLDHGSSQVTGAVTTDTISAPSPQVVPDITILGGTITGKVLTKSPRIFTVAGYVNTSHGRVQTKVAQSIFFSNTQSFNITASTYLQDIRQITGIAARTTVKTAGNTQVDSKQFNWPLHAKIFLEFKSDGSIEQITHIQQVYQLADVVTLNGKPTFSSVLSNMVTSQDTLLLNSSFQITGNQGQKSSQTYFSSDTSGACYSRTLTAADNKLTAVINGQGCP